MNYIAMLVLSVLCIGLGWFFGYSRAEEQFLISEKTDSFIGETKNFLQDTNDLLRIEMFRHFQAESDIYTLEYLADKKYVLVEDEVVDRLGRYYKSAKESILDGMASIDEESLVQKINNLAKENTFLKGSLNMKNKPIEQNLSDICQ